MFAHDVVEVVCLYRLLDDFLRSGIWQSEVSSWKKSFLKGYYAEPPILARYIAGCDSPIFPPRLSDALDLMRGIMGFNHERHGCDYPHLPKSAFEWLYTPSIGAFESSMSVHQNRYSGLGVRHELSDRRNSDLDIVPIYNHCVAHGWVDMVENMLNRGVNINATTHDGITALQLACTRGHTEVIDLLLDRGADTAGALSRAAAHGHEDLVLRLLNRGLKMPANMAGRAALLGRTGMLKMVLERGANPNWGRPHPFVSAVKYENKAMFELLLEYRAVLTEDVRGTCVKVCEEEGLESMMEFLSENGVSTRD